MEAAEGWEGEEVVPWRGELDGGTGAGTGGRDGGFPGEDCAGTGVSPEQGARCPSCPQAPCCTGPQRCPLLLFMEGEETSRDFLGSF